MVRIVYALTDSCCRLMRNHKPFREMIWVLSGSQLCMHRRGFSLANKRKEFSLVPACQSVTKIASNHLDSDLGDMFRFRLGVCRLFVNVKHHQPRLIASFVLRRNCPLNQTDGRENLWENAKSEKIEVWCIK